MTRRTTPTTLIALALLAFATLGCATKPGTLAKRHGDEIVVAGQHFRIGTPVVLWTDHGGYNAYRVDKQFAPWDKAEWPAFKDEVPGYAGPQRYSWRINRFNNGMKDFTEEQINEVRRNWPLKRLQEVVDQFVLHYDVSGTSTNCFNTLHDHRFLSVHFMLDVDGTIYQTLDLQERAWHAGTANSRSVGIEITSIGAYPADGDNPFDQWYATDEKGTYVTIPEKRGGADSQRVPGKYYLARDEIFTGTINGSKVVQHDLTEAQYKALIKLAAGLVRVFPKMHNDYPRDADGNLIVDELTDEQFAAATGFIGHWHETKKKIDPGPAFDWERLRKGVARELRGW